MLKDDIENKKNIFVEEYSVFNNRLFQSEKELDKKFYFIDALRYRLMVWTRHWNDTLITPYTEIHNLEIISISLTISSIDSNRITSKNALTPDFDVVSDSSTTSDVLSDPFLIDELLLPPSSIFSFFELDICATPYDSSVVVNWVPPMVIFSINISRESVHLITF